MTKINERGQFVPIAAMVTFTAVMMIVAAVNIYKVSLAKLKVQNLADAAALNLASQQAQAFNVVADRNEWMNNMVDGVKSPNNGGPPCSMYTAASPILPPLECVENTIPASNKNAVGRRWVFNSRGNPSGGAISYALLVHSINSAQAMFVSAYNSFLGARSPTQGPNVAGPTTGFVGLLKNDIPDLDQPGIRLYAWNKGPGPKIRDPKAWAESLRNNIDSRMDPLGFEIDHNIRTRYRLENDDIIETTFGRLLYGSISHDTRKGESKFGPLYSQRNNCSPDPGCRVGWMVPRRDNPRIDIPGMAPKIGIGVIVSKNVDLGPLGTKTVLAKSMAYIVEDSGSAFKPTYWVKLAN